MVDRLRCCLRAGYSNGPGLLGNRDEARAVHRAIAVTALELDNNSND